MPLTVQTNLARANNYANYRTCGNRKDVGFVDELMKKSISSTTASDSSKSAQSGKISSWSGQVNSVRTSTTCFINKTGLDASAFKEVEMANYRLMPDAELGALRIYVNGECAGSFFPENMSVQEDPDTGLKVLIGENPSVNSTWYDAIPVTDELEKALAEAVGVDEIPHKKLDRYYIGTHAQTGIRYLMRPGDEGKGGKVLLCNAVDEARYKALSEEYARRYPDLVTSPEAGEFYASLEIRGMAHRGANGIVTTHPDCISYSDNSDPKKNWSAMIDERTWTLLLSWLRDHELDTGKMTGFKYWDGIFSEIGGSYERVWSDDELKQGYLYQ